jgi:IS5 family transposase
MSFEQFVFRESYKKVYGLGDRLSLMNRIINWEPFIPLVSKVFFDNKETGGRPHTDELVIVKSMILQSCYGLSDPELEYQIHDRLSFRNFLGFPDRIPDFSSLWKIRERLKNAGVDRLVWEELQRQMKEKGYEIKKGVIQDASFIEADLGRKRHHKEKKAKKAGKEIKYTDKQISHIDKDATFSVKHGQVHFGYKNHVKSDADNHLILDYEVTTASLHDNRIDLVKEGDNAAFRDKGYFGRKLNAKDVDDKTMKRATRGRKLNGGEQKRNKAISRIRSVGERPFAVIKCVFKGGRTKVKTLGRVSIKEMFRCFAFNLYQLVTLDMKACLAT